MANKARAERGHFTLSIRCQTCGMVGFVTWEEATPQERVRGADHEMIAITNGFRREVGRTALGSPRIVCDHCEDIVPD